MTDEDRSEQWLNLVRDTMTKDALQDNGMGPSIMGSMVGMCEITPELKEFMSVDPKQPWSSVLPSLEAVEAFVNSKLINEQRRFEFLMAEFDAASQSDHPIAIAFVSRVCYMYGVDSEMYKGAMKRYESKEVEAAQNILNLWGKWCFETFRSDENVAFRTKIVDMITTSYMQNMIMKAGSKSFKSFKELKSYVDNGDSSKVSQNAGNHSVPIYEDAIDAFISAQRKTQKVEKQSNQSESVNDIESRYIWLSKGG